MKKTELKRKLHLFRSSQISPDFRRDLELFLNLDPEIGKRFLRFFVERDVPYGKITNEETKQLQDDTGLSKNEIEDSYFLIRFILKQLATRDITVAQVSDDLVDLGCTADEVASLRGFIEAILEKHGDIKKKARVIAASNATIDTVTSLQFSLDLRAVFDEDGTMLEPVPVLIASMELTGEQEQERNVVFQLNSEKLETFLKLFSEQKDKLDKFAGRFLSQKITYDRSGR